MRLFCFRHRVNAEDIYNPKESEIDFEKVKDAENHSEYRYFLEAKFNGVVDFGKNIEVKENEIGRDKICRKPG